MAENIRLLLTHADGAAVDFGWHDADPLFAEAFGDVRGLRSLHGQTHHAAALGAWWALRPMLITPRELAEHCGVTYDQVSDAADFLYRLARGCGEHGAVGTLEVIA